MKFGGEDKKKLAILCVAGAGALGAVAYMASQLFPSTPSVPAPAVSSVAPGPVAAAPARSLGSNGHETAATTTAASLDPTLHMGPMLVTESLQYRGSGRNIFSLAAAAPTVALPRPIASARTGPVQTASALPVGPAGPPPIDLRFFGTATRPGKGGAAPRAFLLRGDEVYLASVGDIVQRRYKVLSITANALTVQDLSDNHQQTLPLASN